MQILFVEKPRMELRYERACLLLYEQGQRVGSVPLMLLDKVVVAPHVALSAGVLGVLAEQDVGLLVLNSRYPKRSALLSGTLHGDVHRRMRQYELYHDERFRAHWAGRLVKLKLIRQYGLLETLRRKRPDLRHALGKGMATLDDLLDQLLVPDPLSLASLRGIEGAAAAAYFACYRLLFAKALAFTERNRRPPKDPVNVCLSLAYTLFYQEAVNALKCHGLDTAIGCYHELYYSRDSLACDLLEPVRPLLDAWVYRLFHEQVLRAEDFAMREAACLFKSAGKTRFYQAAREKTPPLRRLLRCYARVAAAAVAG